MPRLLIVHHSPTKAVRALTDAVIAGAHDDALEGGVDVRVLEALAFARGEAGPDDLIDADGYVLGTTANFGTMSGALKHMFDSTFLTIGGALSDDGSGAGTAGGTSGRPLGLYVHGRYDTSGAVHSVLSLTGALGWRQVAEVLEVKGDVSEEHRERAYDLGGTIAATLLMSPGRVETARRRASRLRRDDD